MTSAVIVEPPKPAIHGLLCCIAAAGPLFVTVFVVEGARRPDYKPLRAAAGGTGIAGGVEPA